MRKLLSSFAKTTMTTTTTTVRLVPVLVFLLSAGMINIDRIEAFSSVSRTVRTNDFQHRKISPRRSPRPETASSSSSSGIDCWTMLDAIHNKQDESYSDEGDFSSLVEDADGDCWYGTSSDLSFSRELHRSLSRRIEQLNYNIGRRYVCCTQHGFLNVHKEPVNPFDTDNVIGQLHDGQIVTSTGPARGLWIPHDSGGWSISVHGGFVWLEALDE
jgi:hypothetical protein